jgi:MSHA biogenesis protein MshQ
MMASPCNAATETVLDTFSQKSYDNQAGTAEWSSDWREYNDDGRPNSGNLAINQGALQFNGSNSDNAMYIIRSVDLSAATSAELSFDFVTVHLDDGLEEGEVALYISDNGGTTWTWLTNINRLNPQTGSWSGDISAYMSTDTRIRLIQSGALSPAEGVYFDNVQIAYQVTNGGIDHYKIVHDGTALTCSPEAVTIRACVDADCTSLYTDDVDIDLSPPGWVGGDRQTLSGGSGVFRLRHTTPGPVTLSVSSQDPPADSGPQCVDGAVGSSCVMAFHLTGFIFDVPDLTSCGEEKDILIAAVRADGEQCVGDDSFAVTTRNVNFWYSYQDPATGTRPVYVNGSAVSGASPGTAVELTFDGQAQSLLDVRYADAGQVGLSARFEGSGEEDGLIMVGSDSFVASPHHLRVNATTDGTTPLDNGNLTGTPHWKAGEDFTVEVIGVCSDDSVTPNFAATTSLNAPTANPAPGTFTGGPLAAADYRDGVFSGTAAYSEVGTVTLQAVATNYLGSGRDVSGSTVVGRFTPARFALSWYQISELTPACSSGRFTYVGQTFGYAAAPVVKVTALNQLGDVTENYTETGWWKITEAAVSGRSYSTDEGSFQLSGGGMSYAYPVDDEAGSGILTFDEDSAMKFDRGDPAAPFYADIDLEIDVVDADGIRATEPLSISDIPFTGENKGNGVNTDEMRWGRLALQNAYGSEQVALPMPFRAEYFNGSAFVTNTQDSCTGLASTILQLTDKNGNDYPVETPIPVGTGTDTSTATSNAAFVSGEAGLRFSAPGSEGFIDVLADLSSLPWLLFDWKGVGPEGPTARATFGIYKSRPGIIYRRETYR